MTDQALVPIDRAELAQSDLEAFSLGFELGRHPETLLGEMVEV